MTTGQGKREKEEVDGEWRKKTQSQPKRINTQTQHNERRVNSDGQQKCY